VEIQARRADFESKFRIEFSEKCELAFLLGIVDESECSVVTKVRSIRNEIAHPPSSKKRRAAENLGDKFGPSRERELWDLFSKSSFGQYAPDKYSGNLFPFVLAWMLLCVSSSLQSRAKGLKAKRLSLARDTAGKETWTITEVMNTIRTAQNLHRAKRLEKELG
jgi:hypothetical protein